MTFNGAEDDEHWILRIRERNPELWKEYIVDRDSQQKPLIMPRQLQNVGARNEKS